jgi:hypothetical protein
LYRGTGKEIVLCGNDAQDIGIIFLEKFTKLDDPSKK